MGTDDSDFLETADVETSSDGYAARFSGATGEWMLAVQERIAVRFLAGATARTVLDVGGGHGQLAGPLCRAGYTVTVLGSSDVCRARIAAMVDAGQCRFQVGDVLHLPFPDRSFETVLCFRLITHCAKWPGLISELCRVADRSVIVDYPTSRSLNKIAPALFGAKKQIEGNTRTWRLFSHGEIEGEFVAHGYRRDARIGQFFFPMVLHRMLKCRPVSAAMEGATRLVGLNRLLGSPVISRMVRT